MNFVSDLYQTMNKVGRFRYTAGALLGLAALCLGNHSLAVEQSSARWGQIKNELLGERVVLDGADVIELDTPVRALDAAVVPVGIRAKIEQTPERYIRNLYLVIENNPSPVAAVFEFPGDYFWETISTRVRVNAYTDLRVLAEFNTGETYMTSNFVKASGGCSAPALKDPAAAAAQLGKMKFVLPEATTDGPLAAKLLIKHPNSSGLQFDQISRNYIPANYVRNIEVTYNGRQLFKAATDISISEDPAIWFGFDPQAGGVVEVKATDSKGRNFDQRFDVAGRR